MKNMRPNINKIAKILGFSKSCKTSTKLCGGFSKNVYQLTLSEKTKKLSVSIKKSSQDDLMFYKNILEKYKLNSFKLMGSYKEKNDIWIITKWVESKKINNIKIYDLMIKWLIKKDKIFTKKYGLIKNSFNMGENWWKMIKKNNKSNLLDQDIYIKILSLKNIWGQINSILKKGPQSLCHNDFEPKNILFSKNNKFYVFDWSRPCAGSPFIDLARLINNVPINLKETIINIYKKNFKFTNFDLYLKTAIIRDQLSVFAALCNHINNGYKNEIDIKKFTRYAKIISSYQK